MCRARLGIWRKPSSLACGFRIELQHIIAFAIHPHLDALGRTVAGKRRDKISSRLTSEAEDIRDGMFIHGHVEGVSNQNVVKRRLCRVEAGRRRLPKAGDVHRSRLRLSAGATSGGNSKPGIR